MTAVPSRIYLESRYRKLVRDLPQTVHWCPACRGGGRRRASCRSCGGRGRLAEDSVQQLVARRVLSAYRARDGKFHGAGREDLDVRMLGRGRPFVFEVVGPRATDVDLTDVLRRINEQEVGRIEVAPFIVVGRERVGEVKEARCAKEYRILVAAELPLDPSLAGSLVGRRLEVAQRTPLRVLRTRADVMRERWVTVLAVRPAADGRLEIDVRTAHGTYVKEWVSGEDGRSVPALADLLGVPCRCEVLDVLEILDDAAATTTECTAG